MPNITQIPAPRVNIVDEKTGLISREWFRFLNNVYTIVGGENRGVILPENGGTGTGVVPTNGQLPIGNGATYTPANLTQGTGLTITNGAGSVALAITNTGVTAGAYGSASVVPNYTVNAQGQLTVAANTSIAIDTSQVISGIFPIARGGTNTNATPTAGTVAYGTGTAIAYSAVGTAGQALVSNGASAPSWSTITSSQWVTSGANIYYTTGNVGIGTTSPGSALDVKGTLRLSGASSGYVGLAPAAAAGSTTYTLPSADGSANQVLRTNGSGVLSWVTSGSGTVTSVSGTGTVSGISLSGTVTTSGSLTLGGTLSVAASDITSGTINTARLASGSASSTTFLRGDQTWASISSSNVTTALGFTPYPDSNPSGFVTSSGSVAIAGANICVLNRSFVKIWTGQDYLVGQTEVVLMVLIMFVKIIQDVDGALILLSDDAKCICVTGLKAITVTLSIGCFMIPKYDQFGLLLSLLSGSIFGLIKFKKRLSIIFGKFEINFLKFLLSRNAFVPMFLLIVSAFIGSIVKVNHWFGFVICVPLITLLSVGVALVLCCSNAERRSLLGYCNNTLRKVMR